MRRSFFSPFLSIALFVGSFSFYLAYKGQYEAAMAGAGVAIAAATASTNRNDDKEELIQEREELLRDLALAEQRYELTTEAQKRENQLLREKDELQRELDLAQQHQVLQDKIRDLEVELGKLKLENEYLSGLSDPKLLPESQSKIFPVETLNLTETQFIEKLESEDG